MGLMGMAGEGKESLNGRGPVYSGLFGPAPRPRGHTPWLTELMLKSGIRSAGIAARVK
ncbi:hypothetical protein FHS38_000967 [Streptomyces netropsis]|uniref:Uncharacterized protein n=1 Tax=Streptomyces netropsis TaxID=55404 RepID=A0A7W7PDC1_STRNE|nr:hypothetical protein [Streptomyces netropsis]GGR48791.1 hypothetical protein GCM10010219_62790 [Streptomyces netropsis]